MEIKYSLKAREDGNGSDIHLKSGGEHMGTIFRTSITQSENEFEKKNNIITLWQGKRIISILWGATELIDAEH